MDAEVLATLRPYITAVPYYLPININTASPVLLAALMEQASAEQMQAVMTRRAQQVLTAVTELWQLPPLSALDSAQQQALAPILAVDSQAFTALISATADDSSGVAKQRFATVLIANTRADNGDSNKDIPANPINGTDDNTSPQNPKDVSQRLWAFRPNF